MTRLIKNILLDVYNQLHARKNLYHLRDQRAFSFRIGATLLQAAQVWPAVLPLSPQTILDVGACVGDVARQLAELYQPEFVGLVEPQPELSTKLQKLNLASGQRIFSCALGRIEGTVQLNVLANNSSTSLLQVAPGCDELFHRPMNVLQIVDVPMRTLDSVFNECGLEELDLLKVDVQGYELEVFAGGRETLRRTRVIVCEASFFEHYLGQPLFQTIYQHMIESGYRMHKTFGYSYDDRGHPLQCDVVFVNLAKL